MSRFTKSLEVGNRYDRKTLAKLWGLAGYQAIGRGVFTPKGESEIFLFITRERLGWMTPYDNYLDLDLLFCEGQQGHRTDRRIVDASRQGEEIHLFYRDTRATPFTYYGNIVLINWEEHKDHPSKFVFQVLAISPEPEDGGSSRVEEDPADYFVLSKAGLNSIDRAVMRKSRGIAQRVFRGNLLRLWEGSCAVTSVKELRVLRSSHIKPWSESDAREKTDHFNGLLLIPNLDSLFDEGLISFRNNGRMIISTEWEADDQRRMHVVSSLKLRNVNRESFPYLEFHRDVKLKQAAHG